MSIRIASAIPPTVYETFPRVIRKQAAQSSLLIRTPNQFRPIMSAPSTSAADYKFQTSLPTNASSSLDQHQSIITNSILDLFGGFPSKRKLALWTDDASFHDPLTMAEGRKQYEAQWYGLKASMSEIEQQHSNIIKGGNPIELRLKTRYKVKGVGKEEIVDSRVLVHLTSDGQKITKVEDKWNGDVPPEGAFAKVCLVLRPLYDRNEMLILLAGFEKSKQRHCPRRLFRCQSPSRKKRVQPKNKFSSDGLRCPRMKCIYIFTRGLVGSSSFL